MLDNGNLPKEPSLSESEKADTSSFLNEILRILPLLNVNVFEKPVPISAEEHSKNSAGLSTPFDVADTVVVPAKKEGFQSSAELTC